MTYKSIGSSHLRHRALKTVFERANMYLSDTYGMFSLPLPGSTHGAACNFSIALTLFCIIDGLARDVYPTRLIEDPQQRFKMLIRDRLCWGSQKKGWIDKNEAARLLYLEFRNPLVHELGQDKVTSVRRQGFGEPVIGKWGRIPQDLRDIAAIEAIKTWDENWPILYVDTQRMVMKLCDAALYWGVKQLAHELSSQSEDLKFAMIARDFTNKAALR